ncbi:MAG TPA: YaeQ family protein [Rhodocyclaceae bacterium]|nr:YaeQ family protein [Rhodocyclaceae bacterium]
MAIKSTIFKAELQVADLDRNRYGTYSLTIARHPSENDARMMLRLLAFALFADEALEFGKGISSDDEPALWQKDLTGEIVRWIELGEPDERILRRAAGRAREVVVLTYGGNASLMWWQKNGSALGALSNLRVVRVTPDAAAALATLAERGMQVQATIEDGHVIFTDGSRMVEIEPEIVLTPKGSKW